jgi:hypothetical protein
MSLRTDANIGVLAFRPEAPSEGAFATIITTQPGRPPCVLKGEIRLRNPRLPAFLDEVMLRDLRLGSSSVDLRVRRQNNTVSLDTLRINSDIRVSIVLTS